MSTVERSKLSALGVPRQGAREAHAGRSACAGGCGPCSTGGGAAVGQRAAQVRGAEGPPEGGPEGAAAPLGVVDLTSRPAEAWSTPSPGAGSRRSWPRRLRAAGGAPLKAYERRGQDGLGRRGAAAPPRRLAHVHRVHGDLDGGDLLGHGVHGGEQHRRRRTVGFSRLFKDFAAVSGSFWACSHQECSRRGGRSTCGSCRRWPRRRRPRCGPGRPRAAPRGARKARRARSGAVGARRCGRHRSAGPFDRPRARAAPRWELVRVH